MNDARKNALKEDSSNTERAEGERRFATVYSGDKCKFEVEGLEPGATYCFQVQAVNKLGAGPYSGMLLGLYAEQLRFYLLLLNI